MKRRRQHPWEGPWGRPRSWETGGGKTWGRGGQWGDSAREGKPTAPLRLKGQGWEKNTWHGAHTLHGAGSCTQGHVLQPGHSSSHFQDAGRINEWNLTSLLQMTGMGHGEAWWCPPRHTLLSFLVERRRISQKRTRHNRIACPRGARPGPASTQRGLSAPPALTHVSHWYHEQLKVPSGFWRV